MPMNKRSTLFSALLRLVPLKWQRVFEHSRMIKYYRVLRRFRKKVFLLGKHGTLIFNKSMPFLFVATVSSLFYLLCLKIGLICFTYANFYQFLFYSSKLILGSIDFFHALLEKVGFSLGSRALSFALRGVGCCCSAGLALTVAFALRAVLTGEGLTNII